MQQGLSAQSIQHSENTPLFGSGQGSGAGVVNWHGHNETLIAMYNKTQPGCTMKSPDNTHTIDQKVISFVDNNKLIRSFQTTITTAMHDQH